MSLTGPLKDMGGQSFWACAELYVHPSVADAEGNFEAIDVECGEYVFFGDGGTVLEPSVRDGRVFLTPTSDNRSEALRERLRTYLARSGSRWIPPWRLTRSRWPT